MILFLIGSPRPNLSCILFDDLGCSITCDQASRLYNCKSTGTCRQNHSCFCAITSIISPRMPLTDYKNLSLEELWNFTFVQSRSSARILQRIKKYPTLSSKVLYVLRKPLRTGDDIKNRLIFMYPQWDKLHDLRSKKKSPINRFIDDNYELNDSALENYVQNSLKRLKNRFRFHYDQETYVQKLTSILDAMDIEDLRYVFQQVYEMQSDFSTEFMERYLHDRELDIGIEDFVASKMNRVVDMEHIDNIVAATVNREFIRIIRSNLQIEESEENCDCIDSHDVELFEYTNEKMQSLGGKQISTNNGENQVTTVEKTSNVDVKQTSITINKIEISKIDKTSETNNSYNGMQESNTRKIKNNNGKDNNQNVTKM